MMVLGTLYTIYRLGEATAMSYLVTWSSGEEVKYLFLPEDTNLDEYLEADKNYIVTCLELRKA